MGLAQKMSMTTMNDKPMGAVLVSAGKCPMGWQKRGACFLCPFGNPSWCHFPRRHHEELCGCKKYLVHIDNGGDDHADTRRPHELL